MGTMANFKRKAEQKRREADRLELLDRIYNEVENRMHWNAMKANDADDEHTGMWFSEPDADGFKYPLYLVYQEVLKAIEKLAEK